MSFTVPSVAPEPANYQPQTYMGQMLMEYLGPWMTLHLAWYCDCLGAPFEQVATLVMQQGVDGDPDYVPGYGALFDVEIATGSYLQFLGQFVGVSIPAGTSDDVARTRIKAETGLKRGTPPQIVVAAKQWLSGTQQVTVIERQRPDGTPDPYWFVVIVVAKEIENVDSLIAAIDAAKVGGLMWTLEVGGVRWADATNTWGGEPQYFSWARSAFVPA